MEQPYLSVVIPAYNESARIVPTLEKISRYLTDRKTPYEILVVDDGSSDDTAARVKAQADINPAIRLIRNDWNQGKGAAVKRGVINSWGEMVYFTDADLSPPIEEIEKFFPEFPHHDVVIGSRAIDGAKMFRKDPAQTIFPLIKISRFSFDDEILFVARRLGYKIK